MLVTFYHFHATILSKILTDAQLISEAEPWFSAGASVNLEAGEPDFLFQFSEEKKFEIKEILVPGGKPRGSLDPPLEWINEFQSSISD